MIAQLGHRIASCMGGHDRGMYGSRSVRRGKSDV